MLKANLKACRNVFPHKGNNDRPKYMIMSVLVVWAIIEVGTVFTAATAPEWVTMIRYAVVAVMFREYGIEREKARMEGEG